jgi:hypothetical protein
MSFETVLQQYTKHVSRIISQSAALKKPLTLGRLKALAYYRAAAQRVQYLADQN